LTLERLARFKRGALFADLTEWLLTFGPFAARWDLAALFAEFCDGAANMAEPPAKQSANARARTFMPVFYCTFEEIC
jgi:hypothetical protein